MAENKEQQNTGYSQPQFENVLSAINAGSTILSGTDYGSYLNSMYSAGKNLKSQASNVAANAASQSRQLLQQSNKIKAISSGQSRQEQIEMNNALNNSVGTLAENTISNREVLRQNTRSFYEGIGDLLTDETFAKETGEAYWNSLEGNDRQKFKKMNELIYGEDGDSGISDELRNNDYWGIFFDESERQIVRQADEDSDQANFFTDSWIDSFTPSAFDKQERIENRGAVSSLFFGGHYTDGEIGKNILKGIGNTVDFLVWDTLEFMTVDLAQNSVEFLGSMFDDESGLDWGSGISAGLGVLSWMSFGLGSKAARTATNTIEKKAIKKAAGTIERDVARGLTDEGAMFVDDIVKTSMDDAFTKGANFTENAYTSHTNPKLIEGAKELDFYKKLNPVGGKYNNEKVYKSYKDYVRKGMTGEGRKALVKDIEGVFGSEVAERFETEVFDVLDQKIYTKVVTEINSNPEMLGKLIKEGALTKQQGKVLQSLKVGAVEGISEEAIAKAERKASRATNKVAEENLLRRAEVKVPKNAKADAVNEMTDSVVTTELARKEEELSRVTDELTKKFVSKNGVQPTEAELKKIAKQASKQVNPGRIKAAWNWTNKKTNRITSKMPKGWLKTKEGYRWSDTALGRVLVSGNLNLRTYQAIEALGAGINGIGGGEYGLEEWLKDFGFDTGSLMPWEAGSVIDTEADAETIVDEEATQVKENVSLFGFENIKL